MRGDSVFVINLDDGRWSCRDTGVFDNTGYKVYRGYEEMPSYIKEGVAVLNLLAGHGGKNSACKGVGSKIADSIYFIDKREE